MAHKRKAKEAFGQPQGQLSAVAAAKLTRQRRHVHESTTAEGDTLTLHIGALPYDGHHSGASTPNFDDHNEKDTDLGQIVTAPALATVPPAVSGTENIIVDEESHLELRLKPGESSLFIGEYDLEVLEANGVATVLGTPLRAKDGALRIYAPSTHPLPPIRALNGPTTVRVSSIESGIRNLEKLSPKFRNIWTSNAVDQQRSFNFLGSWTETGSEVPGFDCIQIDKRTEDVLRHLSSKAVNSPSISKPRILAVGAKSSGKSTFNRLLSNYIYAISRKSRCLYLDIDPGQPEFSPAGQISLVEVTGPILGPPFTHPATPDTKPFRLVRAHAIAATSFKDDPEHYKACVADLIQHADRTVPMIVNSCGWVTGLGADVLIDLTPMLSITEVVILDPVDDSLMQRLAQDAAKTFHRIPRHIPRPLTRTPAESRAMQTMAYFHHKSAGKSASTHPKWSGKPLSRVRPWAVNYASPNIAIMSYGQNPDPEFLAEVLDGSVVAVVVLDAPSDADDSSTLFFHLDSSTSPTSTSLSDLLHHTPSEHLPFIPPSTSTGTTPTLNPQSSQCISLAMIRSIDPETKTLHLLLPLPESQIASLQEEMVVLVRGAFDPPDWAYLEELFAEPERAEVGRVAVEMKDRPWVELAKGEGVGVEGAVWRLRHPPLSAAAAAGAVARR